MQTFWRRTAPWMILLLLCLILLYAFVIQPWHMRWGASDAEVAMPLPGDRFTPPTVVVSTRALTIQAPVQTVWPWIAQIGQERAGFYSYHWLENLFAARMHNADQIVAAWQDPPVGHKVALMDNPQPMSTMEIALIEPEKMLVFKGGWGLYLQAIDPQTTRLIVRYASFPVKGDRIAALYYYPLFEPIHFVMESGMMLGIKARAERTAITHSADKLLVVSTREETNQ